MDPQVQSTVDNDNAPSAVSDDPTVNDVEQSISPAPSPVSDEDFEGMVEGALESVEGTLLFKAKVLDDGREVHAAAAVFGIGDEQQFLLLTLPAGGGQLKVETASRSRNPLARIAKSYAGLMDVLKVAA